jgi:two-component system, NarL family, response regulator NreC
LAHVRILIADDHPSVRRAVARLLSGEPSMEVCGEVANGDEILSRVVELRPDLVLLDVSMPGANGLEVARLLRQQCPLTKIMILSQHDLQHLRPSALEAGADGCVDKAQIVAELLPAIQALFKT